MTIIAQIFVLFGLCMVGNLLSGFSPIPIPGSVIAMVLLLVLLATGVLKQEKIAQLAEFLQKNMVFLFIPAGVGMIAQLDVLKANALGFLAVGVLAALITFAVTGLTVTLVAKLMQKGGRKQ